MDLEDNRWKRMAGVMVSVVCSIVLSAQRANEVEKRFKFEALHRYWWHLHMNENYRVERETQNKQINTNNYE